MVVLVNAQTGPSELIAAAIKRTQRGVLVGRKTSGFAASKKVVNHPDGSADIAVVADFYLTRTVPITGNGVEPDRVMDESALQEAYINKAIEILKAQ